MSTEYIPHVIKNGSRQHVISWHGGNKGSYERCNVKNCEVNKRYDQYFSDKQHEQYDLDTARWEWRAYDLANQKRNEDKP